MARRRRFVALRKKIWRRSGEIDRASRFQNRSAGRRPERSSAMIAPRVEHPLVRTADNESGRCTEWTAKHPAYAALYDHPRSTLPSCRFARAPPIHQPSLPINYASPFTERAYQVSAGTLAYHAPLPCMEPSPVEQPQSQCGQLRHQNAGKSCQLGPVDVEDLALYFEPEKSQPSCPSRPAYRPSINSSNFRRAARSIHDPYPSSSGEQLSEFAPNVPNLPMCDWLDGQFCNTCTQHQFTFCTEERWLQCPASDRCPLYDDAVYPYGRNPVLPPCVYEDLGNEYPRYGDEQILEDYL